MYQSWNIFTYYFLREIVLSLEELKPCVALSQLMKKTI